MDSVDWWTPRWTGRLVDSVDSLAMIEGSLPGRLGGLFPFKLALFERSALRFATLLARAARQRRRASAHGA